MFGARKRDFGNERNQGMLEGFVSGEQPGMSVFISTISPEAKGAWEKAFAVCRLIEEEFPPDGKVGVARLTKQEPVEVPAYSKMILWAQVLETSKPTHSCVLVEGTGDDEPWHVARTLATVKEGKVPICVKNVNPFPVIIPQHPLASVYQVHGEKELVLRSDQPGTVEVDVQNVQLSPVEEQPVLSLKGDGLTPGEQQEMDRLLHRWSIHHSPGIVRVSANAFWIVQRPSHLPAVNAAVPGKSGK